MLPFDEIKAGMLFENDSTNYYSLYLIVEVVFDNRLYFMQKSLVTINLIMLDKITNLKPSWFSDRDEYITWDMSNENSYKRNGSFSIIR